MCNIKFLETICVYVSALCLAGSPVFAAGYDFHVASATVGGETIPVYLYKPTGVGPFPLIVLSHGNPRSPEERVKIGRQTLNDQAVIFAQSGAAVAVPIRRGFGHSSSFAEDYRMDCSRPDYHDAGLEAAKDIIATIDSLASDHDIDTKRVVLVGHSAGGFASIAAGSVRKVLGVVSFAGGRGSNEPDVITCEDNLISAMAQYGKLSPEKELWIFSENDHFIPVKTARSLYDAFVQGGGHAELDVVPPYAKEGHFYIWGNLWKRKVVGFLEGLGFYR